MKINQNWQYWISSEAIILMLYVDRMIIFTAGIYSFQAYPFPQWKNAPVPLITQGFTGEKEERRFFLGVSDWTNWMSINWFDQLQLKETVYWLNVSPAHTITFAYSFLVTFANCHLPPTPKPDWAFTTRCFVEGFERKFLQFLLSWFMAMHFPPLS